MQIGAAFPNADIGTDVGALRAFVQGLQELGYQHLVMPDHVAAGDPAVHNVADVPYSVHSLLHEPMTVYAYITALAPRLELVPCVIILPQRQAVLVAKQAAELDVLSGGRLRLGVGVGRIKLEYEAIGASYHDRGRRMEEQIEVMRRLWTEQVVTFDGRYHQIQAAGINPLPIQRPIPIWIGATSDPALRRAALLADGIFPLRRNHPVGGWPAAIERVRGWLEEAGRDPSSFGIEARIDLGTGTPDDWRAQLEEWRGLGLTHLSVGSSGPGVKSIDAHLARLRQAHEVFTSA
jgi:probable F420-dependent oxidoreductase